MKFHIDKFFRLKTGYITLVYRATEQPEARESLQISLGGQSVSFRDVFHDDLLELSEALAELYKKLEVHNPKEKDTENPRIPDPPAPTDLKGEVIPIKKTFLSFFKKKPAYVNGVDKTESALKASNSVLSLNSKKQ